MASVAATRSADRKEGRIQAVPAAGQEGDERQRADEERYVEEGPAADGSLDRDPVEAELERGKQGPRHREVESKRRDIDAEQVDVAHAKDAFPS